MNPEEMIARQICLALDQGVRELDPSVVERLRAGRERALQHQWVPVGSLNLAGAGSSALHWRNDDERHPVRTVLAILALLLGVACAYYWNAFDQATQNEEIDSALLADELPPNAYLDKGFQAWLEKTARASE